MSAADMTVTDVSAMEISAMHHDDDRLSGRLPMLDPALLQGEQRSLYDLFNKQYLPWAESSGFMARKIPAPPPSK